jgi:hypothetical protein
MKATKVPVLIGLVIMFVTSSYATIRTVSNYPTTTIAQFNTIQAAVNASSSGDTIYIHGSPIQYSGFTITNKQLVIIGPGWSPDKVMPFGATVQGFSITGVGSSNSEIQGLIVVNSIDITGSIPSNIRFIRNSFNSTFFFTSAGATYSGYLFEGNIFNNAGIGGSGNSTGILSNVVFQNNYFYSPSGGVAHLSNFSSPLNTVIFDHNLWFGPSSGSVNCFANNCKNLILTNNIFVRRDAGANNSFSSFSNNITFNAGNNSPWDVNNNLNNGGNVSNQDPQMAAQTDVNGGTNNPLLNFTIAAGPADNTGTDGKDMGLLYDTTGSLNWTNSRNSRFPRIFSMNITNPTIASGGTLNVNVEARKSN